MDYRRAVLNFSFLVPNLLAGMARPGVSAPLLEDIAFLKSEGIGAILSLTETPLDRELLHDNGIAYFHVPIGDFSVARIEQVEQSMDFIETMLNLEKRAVAVHCGAGCGRTGMMLACYLVKKGSTADAAIDEMRAKRPCSIETEGQKALVYQYEEYLKYKSMPD